MANITLVHSSAEYDCEDCGPSYAAGLEVIIDGVTVAGEAAHAHCFSESSPPSLSEILTNVLGHFGIAVNIEEMYDV